MYVSSAQAVWSWKSCLALFLVFKMGLNHNISIKWIKFVISEWHVNYVKHQRAHDKYTINVI